MGFNHFNDGTQCKLEPEIIPGLRQTLIDFRPELLVELGTLYGGFTKYLASWFPRVPIYTFDKQYRVSEADQKFFKQRGNVTFIVGYKLLLGDALAHQILRWERRKFVLCDNGNKTKEMELYAPDLQSGDLLAVHDYGTAVHHKDAGRILKEFVPHKGFNKEYSKYTMRLFVKR